MENRDRIIEAAAGLYRIYGIKSVTMDSLANHLGMSKRTIYELFSDKDELLIGVFHYMANKQNDLVKKVLSESENAIVAIFKLIQVSWDHFQSLSPAFQEDMKRFHKDVLSRKSPNCEMPDYRNNQQILIRGIKEKLFRKDINTDLVNRCFNSMAKMLVDNDLYPFDQFSRIEVISNTMINYMKGISTAEGLELIYRLEKEFRYR